MAQPKANNPQDFNKQKINVLKSRRLFVRKLIFSVDIYARWAKQVEK